MNAKSLQRPGLQRQSGFSLIEVLVAAVIMSVGVLGVAGMQVASLQQNRTALLRSEAQQIAWDIADRMLVNVEADYSGIDFTDTPSLGTNCNTSDCSFAQMAAFDITQWQCAINSVDGNGDEYGACDTLGITGSLPGGQGQIETKGDDDECDMSDAQDEGEYCVIVRWLNTDGSTYSSVRLRTRTKFDDPPVT